MLSPDRDPAGCPVSDLRRHGAGALFSLQECYSFAADSRRMIVARIMNADLIAACLLGLIHRLVSIADGKVQWHLSMPGRDAERAGDNQLVGPRWTAHERELCP